MELFANTFNSDQGLIRQVALSHPNSLDREEIAFVLGRTLKRNYLHSSVEWVTSHPYLDQSYFNLAASGICGNTALLDFGDMSYVNLPESKFYNFRQFLRNIGRDNNDSFIFGQGFYRRPMGYNLREIVLNTLFPPSIISVNKEIENRNRSRVICFYNNGSCKPTKLNFNELNCTVQGTYFLCDGSTTNASVLKVCANRPISYDHNLGSKRFINLMQEVLKDRFGSARFVAFGGVYAVKSNTPWGHKIIFNDCEEKPIARNVSCEVNSPETIITTFNSSTELYLRDLEHSIYSIKLNSCQSMHSLSHYSASENFPFIHDLEREEEYEGYFCPATTLYRIDEPLQ